MLPALPSDRRGVRRRVIWKLAALYGAIKRLRGYLWGTMCISPFLGPQGSGKYRKKMGTTTRESRGGSSTSPRLTTHSSEVPNGKREWCSAGFLSRLPRPATEHDRSGSSLLTPVDDEAIYISSGLAACSPPPCRSPVLVHVGPRHWFGWAGAPTR